MTEQSSAALEQSLTAETWRQWEGQVIEDRFPLHRYLGGTDHSGVFLTTYGQEPGEHAAIKLVPEAGNAEEELSRWEAARGLAHPNLIRIFQTGRCVLGGLRLLYVVMEYAEEDLAQILPVRTLTTEETRDMLRPAVDALAYLHGEGMVHGHIKPGNIMACGDQVKLSTDGLRRAEDAITGTGAYDPPEKKWSPAADIWDLGMTIVEVLTQKLPAWERARIEEEPAVPQKLPEPFFGIARRCLRRNPALRLKAADVAARLEPLPAQEHSSISSVQMAKPQSVSLQIAKPEGAPATGNGFFWKSAAAFAVIVLIGVMVMKHHPDARKAPQPPPVAENVNAPLTPPTAAPASPEKPSIKPEAPAPVTMDTEAVHETAGPNVSAARQLQDQEKSKAPIAETAAPPSVPQRKQDLSASQAAVPAAAAPTASVAPAQTQGEADGIHQALPEVLQKARDTIRGTVRLTVKVEVDPLGRVVSADLDAPGPSQYFANLALQASQKWTFPREANGASATREWILHYFFTASDTRAVAVPSKP